MQNPTDAIPPHNDELEDAVVGAVLFSPLVAKIAFDMLSAEDFYGKNKDIFETIQGIEGELDESVVWIAHKNRGFIVDNEFKDKLTNACQKTTPGCIEAYCIELQKLTAARKAQNAAIGLLQSIEIDHETGTRKALSELTAIVPRCNAKCPIESMSAQVEAEIDGTRTILGIPYLNALSKTQFFLPGSITVIVGGSGTSKSLFTGEMSWRMQQAKIPNAKLNLESSMEFHMRRTIAQLAGDSRATEVSFSHDFPDEIRRMISDFHVELKEIIEGATLQTAPNDKPMSCDALCRWVSQQASNGKQVLIIDPITMMDTEERGHLAEVKFIQAVRGIVDRKQVRLVLVTHPKKVGGSADASTIHLDNISGSTAFQRFVDSVFWLEAHGTMRGNFKDGMQVYTEDYNRTIHVLKARLGPGTGNKIGYYLSPDSLRHIERGRIE